MAYIIYKYGYEKAAFSVEIWVNAGGVTHLDDAAKLLRDSVDDISNDIVVQGSRANGTTKATSDIDIAGSAKERTMLHAMETGKIQAGEVDNPPFISFD